MQNKNKIYKFKNFSNSISNRNKLILIIPFILITLLLVIIPLILIFIKSFVPVQGASIKDNWDFAFIDTFILNKIVLSLIVAVIATLICLVLSYPFCFFLSRTKSKVYKSIVIFIATAPIWTSFLVKLVGLKTFFDAVNGFENSTFGNMWTIIGLVYLYIPYMLTPLYTTMINMPANIVNASYDMGRNSFQTFFKVVIPYTWGAMISGITLVFLPALVTVAVPAFLNNSPDGSLIGDIIYEEGSIATTSEIALARASTLSLILITVLTFGYAAVIITKKTYRKIKMKGDEL
ncbi:MAG: ABC transporter permease [Mycoplasmataceae bacterium]|nr:ABC transporter permease [Mycoplasmataceae bacterium]